MKQKVKAESRRDFIKASGTLSAGLMVSNLIPGASFDLGNSSRKVPVYGHLWVYASKFPPNWDCTPILDEVFTDLKYADLEGVELMESILRNDGSVSRLKELI